MIYQIKTPILSASANALLSVINGVTAKTMEIDAAKTITSAASKIPEHVKIDLKARLAAPRLQEIEATPSAG